VNGYKMHPSGRRSLHGKFSGMLPNTRIVLKLAKFYAHVDSDSRIHPSISVILATKSKFSFFDHGKLKVYANKCDIEGLGQPEIAIWPTKPKVPTGYISKSMTGITKIPTETWGFRPRRARRVFSDDSNNHQQPETAVETGNIYVSETMRSTVKIPTANLKYNRATVSARFNCRPQFTNDISSEQYNRLHDTAVLLVFISLDL